jgi:hypothetical protein
MDKASSMHGREQKFIQSLVGKVKVKKPSERTRHTWEGNTNLYGPDLFHIIHISCWPNGYPFAPYFIILLIVFLIHNKSTLSPFVSKVFI